MEFIFNLPVNIVFGSGKINTIGKQAIKYGSKALIVTGRSSTKKTGLLQRVIDLLKLEGISSIVFDKVEPNPLTTTVEKGVELVKSEGCDLIIGLGGGSPMDCSKAIAFCAVNDSSIMDYVYGKDGTGSLPLILVTTTAGTGSEGDSIAVLTNPETNDKKALKKPSMYPKISIVDPTLMTTLPKSIIAPTGFDALCHCIEAYVSKKSQPLSDNLALMGIKLISENLINVYKNPNDIVSWEKVTLGNTLGGMVIDVAGIALPHAMEHPVSGLLDVVHGKGLAALFIEFLRFSIDNSIYKFKQIAIAMGQDIQGLTDSDAAYSVITAIKELLFKLDMNVSLSQLGVNEDMLDWLTDNCLKVSQPGILNNPVLADRDAIYLMYKNSM